MIGRKKAWKLGIVICGFIALFLLLNVETSTRQSINYQNRVFKIPLYLKISNFLDRHYNYKWLVDKILHDQKEESEKAKAIFHWTVSHIKSQPPELDIVDDHVWHIIVRGYGVADQAADVYATLSNYAGLKAFILSLKGSSGSISIPNHIPLSAVYFDGAWHLSDPYNHVQFENGEGRWATIKEIISGDWRANTQEKAPKRKDSFNYQDYFQSLGTIDFNALYRGSRSSIQDPFNRLLNFFGVGRK